MFKNYLIIFLSFVLAIGFAQDESVIVDSDTAVVVESVEPEPAGSDSAVESISEDIPAAEEVNTAIVADDPEETVPEEQAMEETIQEIPVPAAEEVAESASSLLDFMPAEVMEEMFTTESLEGSYFSYLEGLNKEEPKSSGGIFGMLGSSEDIYSFKLSEYDRYLTAYFPESNSDIIQQYIINAHTAKSDWDEVAVAAVKFSYLYPESGVLKSVKDNAINLFQSEKYYRDNIDVLLGLINGTVASDDGIDERYFAFLSKIKLLEIESVIPIFAREAAEFIKLFPNSERTSDVILWMAKSDYTSEQFHTSFLEYRKILMMYPRSQELPFVLYNSGMIQADNFSEFELAITTLREFLLRYPDDTLAAMAQLKIAQVADEKLESWVQAVEEYQAFADNYPTNEMAASSLIRLGEIQKDELNQVNEAVTTYHYIAQLYPASPLAIEALERCGGIFEKEKKYAEAVDEYYSVYEKYPDSENALPALEKCADLSNKRLKNKAKYKEILTIIVDKYPDSKNAKSAQKKLSKL